MRASVRQLFTFKKKKKKKKILLPSTKYLPNYLPRLQCHYVYISNVKFKGIIMSESTSKTYRITSFSQNFLHTCNTFAP